jgi:four helix bundle protein
MKDFNDDDYNLDDEDDFEFSNEDFELTEEDKKEFEAERKRKRNLPVAKKAEEIYKLTSTICDLIDKEKDLFHLHEQMLSNAMMIPAKIANAEGGDLYSLRFDQATILKIHARELLAQTSLLSAEELIDEKYVKLLRKEIEEFRPVFLDWVRSWDKSNDITDEWDIKNI